MLGLYRGEGGFGESVGRTPPRRARTLYEPASADAVRGLQIDTCRGQGCRGREGRLASAGDGVALAAGGRGWRNKTLVLRLYGLNQS